MSTLFISYSSKDREFAERLASDLQRRGVGIFFDKWEIKVGDSIVQKINDGIRTKDFLAIVLSPNSVESNWVKKELNAALMKELDSKSVVVLPIMYKECDIPVLIKDKHYADFRQKPDYDSGLRDLLRAIGVDIKPETILHSQTNSGNDEQIALRALAKDAIKRKVAEIPIMRPGYQIGKPQGEIVGIGPSRIGTKGFVQYYERGLILWHASGRFVGKAFAVYGSISSRFNKMGEERWSRFGFPICDETDAFPSPFSNIQGEKHGGRYSAFEYGEIVWHSGGEYNGQAFAIGDPIRKTYDSVGGSGSFLGFPISEPYSILGDERCDFEGGAIVLLSEGKEVHVVRQLLRPDYSDSPFDHHWKQYKPEGKEDRNCACVRNGIAIGGFKSYIAFNQPGGKKGIQFPSLEYGPNQLGRIKYCGVTIKSLASGNRIRFYVMLKTNATKPQNLEIDSQNPSNGLREENWGDYWRLQVPTSITDGNWHTLIVNLEKSAQQGFTRIFESLLCFRFSERMGISDIVVSESREAIEKVAVNPIAL